MKPPKTLTKILFYFITEMPDDIVDETLSLKRLGEIIEDFIERHELKEEEEE